MIYEINGKYYVKVGYEYNEIEVKLDDNGEVTLSPLKNRIEADEHDVKRIIFQEEKQKFKEKLQHDRYDEQDDKKDEYENSQSKKYNRNKWGR